MKLSLLSIILFCFIDSSFSQVNLNKGLVAYYTFTGEAKDESGKNNNPIFNNISLTEDRFGNKNSAGYFNGKDNYIRIKNSPSLCPDEITMFAIIKPMGFYQGVCYGNAVIDKGVKDNIPGFYGLRFSPGEYTRDCYDGDSLHQNFQGTVAYGNGKTSGDIYIKPGTWYAIVFTYNKDYCRLYLDGEMISSYGSVSKLGKNNDDLFFGKKNNTQYPYWYNGVIDEIRIYNRALTNDEVLELYTQTSQNKPTAAQ